MNQDGSRWIKMNQDESRWIKTNQDESRWIKILKHIKAQDIPVNVETCLILQHDCNWFGSDMAGGWALCTWHIAHSTSPWCVCIFRAPPRPSIDALLQCDCWKIAAETTSDFPQWAFRRAPVHGGRACWTVRVPPKLATKAARCS